MLPQSRIPYALEPVSFRFPALAALAARLPLGAGREVAVALLLVARLAAGAAPGSGFSRVQRAARATAAAHWLGATCPDARVRAACLRVVDATGNDDGPATAAALTKLAELVSGQTSPDARAAPGRHHRIERPAARAGVASNVARSFAAPRFAAYLGAVRRIDISPLSKLMHRVDAVVDGAPALDTVATGFPSVDRILGGGLRRGDLIVLGGEVGSGKSALVLAMAIRMAQDGAPVALFSGEMSVERLLERGLAIEGRVRLDDVRRGALDDLRRASIGMAAIRLRDNAPRLAVLAPGGVAALRDELRRTPEPARVVVVDSIAALAAVARPLDEELADCVRQLKALALELDVAILVTAPVPALDPARRDRRPTLDDFGALGAVKQHADVVLAIFREEMYDPGHGIEGATELLVRKNRNGATGYVDLYFYQKWMRFEDMLDPDR